MFVCIYAHLFSFTFEFYICLDPTLVVDGMACLCHWYSCKDWVCGGQWKEYIDVLKSWVEAFTSAGIKLVFFFDGVIEEKKRQEWVRTDTNEHKTQGQSERMPLRLAASLKRL